MKNREALFPNRIKFTDEETGKQYVGTWDYADSPTEVGTKLTADVFLSNYNAAEYGIKSEDPTPNEVFTVLSKHASRHASNGADPINPADIGAAYLDQNGKVTANQASSAYLNITGDTELSNIHEGKTLKVTAHATLTLGALTDGCEVEIINYGANTVTLSGTLYVAGEGSAASCTVNENSIVACKYMDAVWFVAGGVSV